LPYCPGIPRAGVLYHASVSIFPHAPTALRYGVSRSHAAKLAPDGDADLSERETAGFCVAPCQSCGGALKPNVVFFGENVPDDRTRDAWSLAHETAALLVVGSSLTVYSGYRFVRDAAQRKRPVAILNLGPTRADDLATFCIDGRTGTVLPQLADCLSA